MHNTRSVGKQHLGRHHRASQWGPLLGRGGQQSIRVKQGEQSVSREDLSDLSEDVGIGAGKQQRTVRTGGFCSRECGVCSSQWRALGS